MARDVTIGCDPEGFFARNNVPVPAIGLVGGTKYHPRKLGIGHVQEDNVMWEFNIPPCSSPKQFSSRVQAMLDEIQKIGVQHGCTLQYTPYATFTEDDLIHPQARTIGCDPDFNAWTKEKNPPASPQTLKLIRTASGHVHIGVPNPNENPNYRSLLVQACDLYLGVPSILMEQEGHIRRQFYGKAGCYRPKPYGVEYRVLGNWWVTKDSYRKWVYNQCIKAVDSVDKVRFWIEESISWNQRKAEIVINQNNVMLAKELCEQFSITLPS